MKKIVIILSTWISFSIGSTIIQSCDSCSDGPYNYKLVSIAGEVKNINGIELRGPYQTAYYTVEAYVPQSNGIRYDSMGIDIINTVELLAHNSNVDFFQSAFACSPVTNFELLADMTITSSEDYNDSYPAGTDLQEIMSIRDGYQLQGSSIATFLSQAEIREGNLFLTFEFPPSQSRIHDITVTYKLFNGREFEVVVQAKVRG